jgi:hypothetical protein
VGQFCSVACHHAHRVKFPPVEMTCPACGRLFTSRRGQAMQIATGRQRRAFCSADCAESVRGEHIRRARNPRWNGGRIIDADGYVRIRVEDHATGRVTYPLEHREVAAATIGRPLRANEVAHHVNGVRDDNRPENLQVMTRRAHMALHGHLRGGLNPPRRATAPATQETR